jgi:hypothetical protein
MKNTPMSDDFPSFNFLCPRVHSCECEGIHEDALLPIASDVFNLSAEGALAV